MTINPVDGQIMEINEALEAVVDLKGEKIDFKRDENIKDDIVYSGEGSDGKTYQIQLKSKMVIVSVFDTPKAPTMIKAEPKTKTKTETKTQIQNLPKITEKKDKKEKEEEEEEEKGKNKNNNNNNKNKDKYDLDKVVDQLDKPLLDKEGAKK